MANALFLGDFDPAQAGEKDISAHWYNTCISLNECHYTQGQIMHTLSVLQKNVITIGYNPIIESNRIRYVKDKNSLYKYQKDELTNLFSYAYMLFLLQKSFDLPFYDKVKTDVDKQMHFLEEELRCLNIETATLDPFDKSHGIAIKGELDFNGKVQI